MSLLNFTPTNFCNMELTITLLEPAIPASGEGSGLIDVDVAFDEYGFPYLGAKRIKGILKESALEVLEMCGQHNNPAFTSLFGEDGFTKSRLIIHSFRLKGQKEAVDYLARNAGQKLPVNGELIKNHFTTTLDHTAIDSESGVAKDKSLRKYRALKKGLKFTTTLDESLFTEQELSLLKLACLQTDRMGQRRNRGLGKIAIRTSGENDIQQLFVSLAASKNTTGENKTDIPHQWQNSDQYDHAVDITIHVKEPVVLATQKGDQNTVSTEKYFSGSRIKGIIALTILNKLNADIGSPYTDAGFNAMIHHHLLFSPAFLFANAQYMYPVPLHLKKQKVTREATEPKTLPSSTIPGSEKQKDANEGKVVNGFSQDKPAETIGGTGTIINKVLHTKNTETGFRFHNTRTNRAAGHSIDGGIYYYESIIPGQTFKGQIFGDKKILDDLIALTGASFNFSVGRSSGAEYGQVEIMLSQPVPLQYEETIAITKDSRLFAAALSPVILTNQYGLSMPSLKAIEAAINEALGFGAVCFDQTDASGSDITSIARKKEIETFSNIWKTKTATEYAYAEGSIFSLKATNNITSAQIQKLEQFGIGQKTQEGFGKIKVYTPDEMPVTFKKMVIDNEVQNADAVPELVGQIIKSFERTKKLDALKEKAQKRAEKIKSPIPNSLLARLKEDLIQSESFSGFTGTVKKYKATATRHLERARILDELMIDPDKPSEGREPKGFAFYKTEWLHFFNISRLKNKAAK